MKSNRRKCFTRADMLNGLLTIRLYYYCVLCMALALDQGFELLVCDSSGAVLLHIVDDVIEFSYLSVRS